MSRPLIQTMVRAVARLTRIPIPAIRGLGKTKDVVICRKAVALVAFRHGHSLSKIAVGLGRTDHSTAHHLKTTALQCPQAMVLAHRIERIISGDEPMPEAPSVVKPVPVEPARVEPEPAAQRPATVRGGVRPVLPGGAVRRTGHGYVNACGEIVAGPPLGLRAGRE
jgi:hypothetical protein